ncbi:hypothetical protein SLEP1_g28890 [Rubroshorea leprosula]|uniref:Maturase K n=1 Tax=Rubroshorea leprosula TaxID=152421 RepID=A0AAV5K4H5_9ROSI|nr:hypothetical protein SLEP1_g28890 [Rubroshorea leprosula]
MTFDYHPKHHPFSHCHNLLQLYIQRNSFPSSIK